MMTSTIAWTTMVLINMAHLLIMNSLISQMITTETMDSTWNYNHVNIRRLMVILKFIL